MSEQLFAIAVIIVGAGAILLLLSAVLALTGRLRRTPFVLLAVGAILWIVAFCFLIAGFLLQ